MDHLSDEQLSAAIDGEVTADVSAHLAACGACSARRDQLAAVALAIGAVEPTPPDVADRLVEEALAAATADDGTSSVAAVVALPSRRRRGSRLARAAAAASVVALLAGSAVAVLANRDHHPSHAAASATAAAGSAAPPFAGDAALALTADLGDLGDVDTLLGELQKRSPAPAGYASDKAAEAAGSNAAAAAEQKPTADEAASGDSSGRSSVSGGTAGPSSPPPSSRCLSAATRVVGTGVQPAFGAHLRWHGTDAEVLVYQVAGSTDAPGGRRALVMDRSACALLADQRF